MTPRKRKATLAKDETPAKRVSRGRAVKKQDDPIWATQSSKSNLVNEDLHAKYCDPLTYQNWTKEDWEEIRECLPENAPYNDDGFSVPMHFFKYDPDWRRLVREFQEDLGAGHYEPEWLKQATLAMEERAAGKFDKFKEDQFEAFWGQKQTSSHRELRAGESAKIKLSELVEAGLIKVGDDLSYRRSFRSKAGNLLMIEKNVRVVAITGTTLTVAIPAGQFRYAHFPSLAQSSDALVATVPVGKAAGQKEEAAGEKGIHVIPNGGPSTNRVVTTKTKSSNDSANSSGYGDELQNGVDSNSSTSLPFAEILRTSGSSSTSKVDVQQEDVQETVQSDTADPHVQDKINGEGTEQMFNMPKPLSKPNSLVQEGFANKFNSMPAVGEPDDVNPKDNTAMRVGPASVSSDHAPQTDLETGCIIFDVWKPSGLESRIIEIDGRMDRKDVPIASSWRYIRVQRKNQDLGSLFDIREEHHDWKSSTIVKIPGKDHRRSGHQIQDGESRNELEGSTRGRKTPTDKPVSHYNQQAKKGSEYSKSSRDAEAEVVDSDVESVAGGSEDDSKEERESDGEYVVRNSRSARTNQKPKPQGRSRRLTTQGRKERLMTGELKASSDQELDQNEKGRKKGKPGNDKSCRLKQTHYCPHCEKGFTRAWSLNIHIQTVCKKVLRNEPA